MLLNDPIISKLRTIASFTDLSKVKKVSIPEVTVRTESELKIIDELIYKNNVIMFDLRIIGTFKINHFNSSHNGSTVTVYYKKYNNDCKYIFRILDLPSFFWYTIKTLDCLDKFLKIYLYDHSLNIKSNIKSKISEIIIDHENIYTNHVRYDLRRNNNFQPIMLERYLVINQYTENIVWGPSVSDNTPVDNILKMSSFDLATKYKDTMRQYGKDFVLRTLSKYSGSYMKFEMSEIGTIVDIYYNSDGLLTNQIALINKTIDADIGTELPLDVVLFLLPFHPISSDYFLDSIVSNKMKINTSNVICMVYRLNIERIDPQKMISIMKILYNKLDKSDNDNHNDNDCERFEIIEAIVKNYITIEYEKFAIEINQPEKEEQITDEDINYYVTAKTVVKLMTDCGDKMFIDENYLYYIM